MKALDRRLLSAIAAIIAFVLAAAAQDLVTVGTGEPDIDVPAVQAAVDHGGQVILMGHFSFDRPPTPPAGSSFPWMVLVSKEVVISGTRDAHGEMTTIEGGDVPFAVEALGAHVTIQGLRFVRPKQAATFIYAVSGLVIASCRIERVEPLVGPRGLLSGARGIAVNTNLNSPTTDRPGQPGNVSGTLLIFNNDIDVGATAAANTLGISVIDVGKSPDKEVDIYLSGNNIRNITERAINIRRPGGRAHIEGNVIITGAAMGPGGGMNPLSDGIHAVGPGSYVIAHNSIDSAWANGAGIRVHGTPDPFAPSNDSGVIERAIVADNDVTMSASEGTVFGANSAGIEIRGFARGNIVINNRIRGRARAALSVAVQGVGFPGNNTFVLNDHKGFKSSLADVFVGPGVTNTLVVGTKDTVKDHGVGTRRRARTLSSATWFWTSKHQREDRKAE